MLMDELNRYLRQINLPGVGVEGQEKLKNARVLCVGAGGLGSPLLLYLAAAGIGTIGIIDHDTVELSNLHRQVLYHHPHLGSKKVMAAQQQIRAANPGIEVNTYAERFCLDNAAALISQYDIIADCSDNFSTRYLINHICFQLKKPYVFAGVSQFEGLCTMFL
ncbi:MAG: HesA/MoeB/ThiF family protein, partial [Gammaproteobacteria bacterium]